MSALLVLLGGAAVVFLAGYCAGEGTARRDQLHRDRIRREAEAYREDHR